MRRSTQSVRQKLQARAGREVAQSNNDVLAFADRNREIIQLPEGLETGETMRRERGARTDDDVIQEVIEIFAQGITITASLRYVGLPYATWHKWRKENHCHAEELHALAHLCHLEAIANKTLRMFELLEAQREEAKKKLRAELAAWHEAHRKHDIEVDKWRAEDPETRGPKPVYDGPFKPSYNGPGEWELSSAKAKAKIWRLHLGAGLDRFRKRN
jgi:hypothetical protein